MTEKLEEKVEEIVHLLEQDPRMIELKGLKEKLIANQEFTDLLKKYQMAEYKNSSEAIALKEKIFENKDYLRYQQLENELYFLTLEINQRFQQLKDKKVCGVN